MTKHSSLHLSYWCNRFSLKRYSGLKWRYYVFRMLLKYKSWNYVAFLERLANTISPLDRLNMSVIFCQHASHLNEKQSV
jgi:hypothetical protein